jgi:hypothetical protein
MLVSPLRHGVELVEEEQARQVIERHVERRLDVPRRLADDRGHDVSGRDVHEVHVVLARDRGREERLADPRRPVEQDAVPLDPVPLGVRRVLQQQPDRVPRLSLEGLHPADVAEVRKLLRTLDLEVAAAVADPERAEHPCGGSGRAAPSSPLRRRRRLRPLGDRGG